MICLQNLKSSLAHSTGEIFKVRTTASAEKSMHKEKECNLVKFGVLIKYRQSLAVLLIRTFHKTIEKVSVE